MIMNFTSILKKDPIVKVSSSHIHSVTNVW